MAGWGAEDDGILVFENAVLSSPNPIHPLGLTIH